MAARDRYNPQRFRIPFSAEVAKSVDAVDSKSTVEIRAGSSPAFGTTLFYGISQGIQPLIIILFTTAISGGTEIYSTHHFIVTF